MEFIKEILQAIEYQHSAVQLLGRAGYDDGVAQKHSGILFSYNHVQTLT